jgi:hypothetical protein
VIAAFMTKVLVSGVSGYDAKLTMFAEVKTRIKLHSCRQLMQFRHRPILKVSDCVATKKNLVKVNLVARIVTGLQTG